MPRPFLAIPLTASGLFSRKREILTQLRKPLAVCARTCLEAFLPQRCFLCLAKTGTQLLCPDCSADLPVLPKELCPCCAQASPAGLPCGACLRQPPHFDATYACLRYDFPVDRLIQALKYGHTLAVGRYLGEKLAEDFVHQTGTKDARDTTESSEITKHIDLIMALPLSRQRLTERGFNQALELARPLALRLERPLITQGYQRQRHTLTQASLPWQARQKNIRKAFECTMDLSGQRVLVVDDVMTTGASLNEFARTLKAAGAQWVGNCVLARTLL